MRLLVGAITCVLLPASCFEGFAAFSCYAVLGVHLVIDSTLVALATIL